jgi:N-glycosylase/DNA lyase
MSRSAAITVTASNCLPAVVPTEFRHRIPVVDYDLAATLCSGQAFRWHLVNGGWESVVLGRWVRLESASGITGTLLASTLEPQRDWAWLEAYLQTGVDLESILKSFPDDVPLNEAVAACRGLRLLLQDPWECLAGFILSSTKQIVQIRQCMEHLCRRLGTPVTCPGGTPWGFAFPAASAIAAVEEPVLRECRMGFRAPYLLGAARAISDGRLDLESLRTLPTREARLQLMALHGVGRKIADCVLLFAYGRQDAFPADVWILKVLRHLYFPRRKPSPARLQHFLDTHFGPNAGYAQQYLFHHARVNLGNTLGRSKTGTRIRSRSATP